MEDVTTSTDKSNEEAVNLQHSDTPGTETKEPVKQTSGSNSELETIDSDEEVIDNDGVEGASGGIDTNEGRTMGKICRSCRLMFRDERSLTEHEKSENHDLVKMGYKPSVGTLYCYLCWEGFKDSAGLSSHFASTKHENNVVRNNVKAVCISEEESGECSSKRPRLDYPDVIPDSRSESSLGVVKRLNRDEWICQNCNVVFATYLKAKDHAKSPNHLAVLDQQYPPIPGHHKGTAGFYCFVCWYGFNKVSQLINHNSSERHSRLMKNSGVSRLFRREHLLPPEERSGLNEASDNVVRADEFIVLDEVKGSGGGEVDKYINDTLDEVSSDEEALEKTDPPKAGGLGLDDLEDVDSEEEKIEEPPGLVDVTGLEDVDSSEDELIKEAPTFSKKDSEEPIPKAPSPPIISRKKLRSVQVKRPGSPDQYQCSDQASGSYDKDSIDSLTPVPAVIDRQSGDG